MGRVNRVLPADELRAYVVVQAEKFSRLLGPSGRAAKRLLKGLGDQGPQAVLARMRSEEALFQALLGAPAAREAMTAFFAKAPAGFFGMRLKSSAVPDARTARKDPVGGISGNTKQLPRTAQAACRAVCGIA